MIAFFDPKRGAELEEEVVNQRVLIDRLEAKIHAMEVTLYTQNSRYERELRHVQNDVNNLQHNVRITATSHGVNVWDMESMRDRPSATHPSTPIGESLLGTDIYRPYRPYMDSIHSESPGHVTINEDVWHTIMSQPIVVRSTNES